MAEQDEAGATPELEVQAEDETGGEAEPLVTWPRVLTRETSKKHIKLTGEMRGRPLTFILSRNTPALLLEAIGGVTLNTQFGAACLIGRTWFGVGKPAAANQPYTNAVHWGQRVADGLVLAGWTMDDIYMVGMELLEAARDVLPSFGKEGDTNPLG